MKPDTTIDAARYAPRLWWLMLAGVAARSTTDRAATQLTDGFWVGLGLLCLCALLRAFVRRGPQAKMRAQRVGLIVAAMGIVPMTMRLLSRDWLAALLVLLLAIQSGAYIAAAKRVHVWCILATGFAVLMITATDTRSPLFLPCAAWFTFMALGVLALEHREQRANSAAFVAKTPARAHGGGLLFVGLTLLLTVPVYLFVPRPSGWSIDAEADPRVYRDTPVTTQARLPLAPLAPSPLPPKAIPEGAPDSLVTPLIKSLRHVAHPESGDYGEDFGITDVVRRPVLANNIVLYARSSHAVNLRGRVYDRFAADRWSRTLADSQRIQLDGRNLVLLSQSAGLTHVAQSIDVARDLDPTLVHAPGVERLRFPAASLLRYDDGVLVADAPLHAGTLYSVDARLTLREGRYLLLEPPPRDLTPYLQADTASPRLRELAAKVSAGSTGTLAKALALEQYLRTHYTYTYETLEQQNHTPLDWFLFEGRRGHCEFFASALAMMLRSVGIAARVATGFALNDPNPITGFHEVRALDGHAWVEAYLEGEGWLMLEPTPFYSLPQADVDRQVAEQLDGYLERLATTRALLAPGTLQTRLTLLARDAWQGLRLELRAVSHVTAGLGWLLPLAMAAIAAGLLALYLLVLGAADAIDNLQTGRSLDSLPQDDARTATLQVATALTRVMASRSLARRADWTLHEYAEHLAGAEPTADAIVIPGEFIQAFDAARYGSSSSNHNSDSLAAVVQLLREHIRSNRWPRVRAAVKRLADQLNNTLRRPAR